MISIYTPTYNTGTALYAAYESIKDQNYKDWEWVIADDGSTDPITLEVLRRLSANKKIKIFRYKHKGIIGRIKKLATQQCTGEILVELDHDDELVYNCLKEVKKAFDKDPEVGMVYSNFAEVDADGKSHRYDTEGGITYDYRITRWKKLEVAEAIQFDVYGQNPNFPQPIIYFWMHCPNHVRAYRASILRKIGGYNSEMKFADDYELTVRMYFLSKIVHINKLLYIYFWGDNTHQKHLNEIYQWHIRVRDQYFPIISAPL